ncbi:MAG: class I SAM-dependent methyltransferase [Chloroflexaceae bacterium]|nr:class I SAM-dependent methyltransferase [Chloroflexaceae bacterium]
MLQQLLDALARQPFMWNLLRNVAEFGFVADYRVIERELNPFGGDTSRRFLDYGCGTGQFARSFPAERYIGFDVAEHYVSYAKKRYGRDFLVMSGDLLGFHDGSFDAALIMGVFHHLDDAFVRRAAQELHRVITTDGTILMVEDIPTQHRWNVFGRAMHWLDRGNNIRGVTHYQELMEPFFRIERSHTILSGICDLGVYVLRRNSTV